MKTEPTNASIEAAERELNAQLAIIQAVKPLAPDVRRRVLEAAMHLIEAERLVPGAVKAAGGKPAR